MTTAAGTLAGPRFTLVPGGGGAAALAVATTPVTAAQYRAYLVDTGLLHRPEPGLHDLAATGALAAEQPVTYVSWPGAVAYADWLGGRLGAPVRLPAEAEWERLASGPHRWPWALGAEFDPAHYVVGAPGPAPVGRGRPSPFGLYDVTGNVFEWCAGEAPGLPGSRVVKGGAFILREPVNLRNEHRFTCDLRSCLDCVGFRVVCDDPGVARP